MRSVLVRRGFRELVPIVFAATVVWSGTVGAAPSIDPEFLRAVGRGAPVVDGFGNRVLAQEARISHVDDSGGEWLEVWLRGAMTAEAVHATGAHVGVVAGDVITARIPAALAERLLDVPGLEQLQIAQGLEPQMDISVPETRAPVVWGGGAPDFGTQTSTTTAGNNVVIGVVDLGLDTGHPDLRKSTGTRFLSLWDQTKTGTPPSPFTYGAEYSASQINGGSYMPYDFTGHGTHVASIAAGNGRATAPLHTFVGVAPEADLVGVVLKTSPDGTVPDTRVIEGADYVFRKATALGKKAVVLISLGKLNGPHDGSDPLDAGLSALTGAGKLIVAPAGNYNAKARHAEWTSTASNQTGDITIRFDPYTTSTSDENFFRSEAWYNSAANYQMTVITPTGTTVGPVNRGATLAIQTPAGFVRIENGTYTSTNGSYRAEAYIYRGGPTYPQIASGTWTLRFKSQASGTQRIDTWITSYRVGISTPVYVQGMTNKRLLTSPGNANNVACISAYSTKRTWVDMNGLNRSLSAAILGDIANFSSPGPRRDEAAYPHFAAPGYGVAGALSAQGSVSSSFILPGRLYWINYGTSMAAAHAAGAAALKLSLTPTLTPTQFISNMQNMAVGDVFADSLPNNRWGKGKMRLAAGSTDVEYSGPRAFSMRSPYPNPTRGALTVEFTLSGEHPVPADGMARLRIVDVMGREVRTISTAATLGPVRFRWDGTTNGGVAARAGIYFARVEVGASTGVEKFVLID